MPIFVPDSYQARSHARKLKVFMAGGGEMNQEPRQ